MGTSILHIKTEVECKVFLFDEEKGIATPGKYFNLEVRKGEQDLLFVSTSNEDIQCSLVYKVEDSDCDYRVRIEKAMFKSTNSSSLSFIKHASTIVTKEEIEDGVEDEFGVVYSSDGQRLLKCNNEKLKTYSIKYGTKVICDEAFGDFFGHTGKFLKEIIIPDSLTSIGELAFSGCESLKKIIIPNSVTNIGKCCFSECKSLQQIIISDTIESIGDGAFIGCTSLKQIIIPRSIMSIGARAFADCESLMQIIIPDSIKILGDGLFSGCVSLQNVMIPTSITSIGADAFMNCCALKDLNIPNSITNIGDNAFNGCSSLQNINIPNSITEISNGMFSSCSSLYKITMPKTIKSIGDCAFFYCYSLKVIDIPDSITNIGECAFRGCRSLSRVVIPNSVSYIDYNTFADCINLINVSLPNSLDYIGESAFNNCLKLSYIDIPSGMREYFKTLLPTNLHDKLKEASYCISNIIEEMKVVEPHYLFFDTETTGVPQDYNAPASNTNNWPRLVQLGWILTDESGNEISSGNEIIKPDGFVIPSEASCVHGITTEVALRDGKPLKQVIEAFIKDTNGIKFFVGHNVSFDQKVVGAELYRLGIADTISTARSLDTMKAATDYCKIPGSYGYKWPKLIELHRKLFGCDFEDAHDAMADITATKKCFFEMKRRNLI